MVMAKERCWTRPCGVQCMYSSAGTWREGRSASGQWCTRASPSKRAKTLLMAGVSHTKISGALASGGRRPSPLQSAQRQTYLGPRILSAMSTALASAP